MGLQYLIAFAFVFAVFLLTPKMLKQDLLSYFTDLKYFFKKEFIKKNYWKHFFLMFFTVVLSMPFLFFKMHFYQLPFIVAVVICGGFGYLTNFIYEWFMAIYKECLFDFKDVKFGSYGALIGGAVALLLLNI